MRIERKVADDDGKNSKKEEKEKKKEWKRCHKQE